MVLSFLDGLVFPPVCQSMMLGVVFLVALTSNRYQADSWCCLSRSQNRCLLTLATFLQFEKEVKNSFISELIKVQNKRRQYAVDRRRPGKAKTPTESGAKYLTTVIPFEPGQLTTRHMQIMIKILAAINEDSPTTPTLLTDYILKVLCPKETD